MLIDEVELVRSMAENLKYLSDEWLFNLGLGVQCEMAAREIRKEEKQKKAQIEIDTKRTHLVRVK